MIKLDFFMLKLVSPYIGNPYYVNGNAILHAVSDRLTEEQKEKISVSHGIFTTRYSISESIEVKDYISFFKYREPFCPIGAQEVSMPFYQSVLMKDGSFKIAMHNERYEGLKDIKKSQKKVSVFICFYVQNFEGDKEIFNGIQIGGKRNFGFGETKLKERNWTGYKRIEICEEENSEYKENLIKISIPKIDLSKKYLVKLITPICIESEFPQVENFEFPSFLVEHKYRIREERINIHKKSYKLKLIDNGQWFAIKEGKTKEQIEEIIFKGINRIGNHEKYGYGEFMVVPIEKENELGGDKNK